MLTAGRPEMARRAVECFWAQTYPAKRLMILDAQENDAHPLEGWGAGDAGREITVMSAPRLGLRGDLTIGQLRTIGNLGAQRLRADIIVHWDDDDWSHPNRIAEQVALLQSSGADAVGYREMLFWRGNDAAHRVGEEPDTWSGDQAWLYSNANPSYCLGTSLCYWRRTWEAKPFEATSHGEDLRFCTGLKCVGTESFQHAPTPGFTNEPRMIARIHAGNTSSGYRTEVMQEESRKANPMWRRVPEWDAHCRATMEAA